jgi:tetratricopeptide (TPR) repeat protein
VGQVYALLRLKQNTEALTWANRALEVFPDEPDLLSARGVVFASQGMIRRAVGASDFALAKGGTLAAWLARGEILLAAGNRNAMACFDKALEQAPDDDWKTPAHIGLALTARKKFPGAFDYLQRSVQRKGNNAFLWHELGRAAERLRFNEQALQAYERARDLAPDNQAYKRSLERFHGSGPLQKLFRMLRGGD